jgi:hypothetical protein
MKSSCSLPKSEPSIERVRMRFAHCQTLLESLNHFKDDALGFECGSKEPISEALK